MRQLILIALLAIAHLLPGLAAAAPVAGLVRTSREAMPGSFIVLSYHEARDDVRDYPDAYAVDAAALAGQFAWLHGNGYTPVSLDRIIAARQGGRPLPDKAVLLSFDDAYLSFYERVYPLLREFGYPAVLAVVGRWIDAPQGVAVAYGENRECSECGGVAAVAVAASFPSWGQLREMADSGLVELASHTNDLHRGLLANPQANLEPAATAHAYDAANGAYETQASWRARVRDDLARNVERITQQTGHRPRAVVWPYGSYSDDLTDLAADSGMRVGLTLDDGVNTPDVPLGALRRILIEHNPPLAEFVVELRAARRPEPIRVVELDLDAIYSSDAQQQERNLSSLLDGIAELRPSHVFLQATRRDQDGVAVAAYFPNRHLPLRADLFNRAAWQLASRADVKVFAVMPVGALGLPPDRIAEVYEDLALHASFDGLVFAEPPLAGGAAATPEFAQQLARRVRALRAPLPTVVQLTIDAAQGAPGSADPVGRPGQWSAVAAAFDYVALVATPAAGDDVDPAAWLRALGLPASSAVGSPSRAIFLLRSRPPAAARSAIAAENPVAAQMRALQLGGALNFGYIADDFIHDSPPRAPIAPLMSLRVYPQKPVDGEKK